MPIPLSYPGVYIEEIPSGVRTITGVATSITAFVGRARRGEVNRPIRVQSFSEYTRLFGTLWQDSTMGYAVDHFFRHGGSDALIVRVFKGDVAACTATITLPTATGNLELEARSPGSWGSTLRATVDHLTRNTGDSLLFNLTVDELDLPAGQPGPKSVVATETHRNVSVDPLNPRFVDTVLESSSALVRVRQAAPADESPKDALPPADPSQPDNRVPASGTPTDDGDPIEDKQIVGDPINPDPNKRVGIFALEEADLFNLLVIPPLTRDEDGDVAPDTWGRAADYCKRRRAVLLIDSPAGWTASAATAIADAVKGIDESNGLRAAVGTDAASYAALYFPRLRMPDPLRENRPADFAACGAVAGIITRTDSQRGVWKAPAGLEASFSGVQKFTYGMTDRQNGQLNPLGVNCLRSFPVTGNVVWGARTLAGADQLASEWKYLPVRRLALYIEESLFRGTQWVVFEPNDEPLWAQIRLNVGAFMQNLFRQGAFQGTTPRAAYFVKCDAETTTQNHIDQGIVNILVGFAPLKPAEFVVIKIQQIAGQVQV
jgi:phage tail sheath protein FI